MEFVLFSKFWRDLNVGQMIERTHHLGADGVDFAIRPGYVVNPDNVTAELAPTVARFRDAGLSVSMLTLDCSFTSPNDPTAEPIASAMQKAGVPVAKLGYYQWKAGKTPYWDTVKRIREALEGFQALAEKYDITFVYHTHSHFFGQNTAQLMDLLSGFDPKRIGAYLDTGHLAYCGEQFPMAVDIVGDYLTRVSFKDTAFQRTNDISEELPAWKRVIVPAGYGVANWRDVFCGLRGVGFDGVCSVHCEFEAESEEEFIELQKREVAFLREQHAAVSAG